MTARYARVPTLSDVPYPVQMEPNLVVEYYASAKFASIGEDRRPTLAVGLFLCMLVADDELEEEIDDAVRVEPGREVTARASAIRPAAKSSFLTKDGAKQATEGRRQGDRRVCRTRCAPRARARCWWCCRASTRPARTAPCAACSTNAGRSA